MRPTLLSSLLMPAAGAAALLAFAPFGLYPLAWIALVPLLCGTGRSGARRFVDGYLYGLGFYGLGLAWLPDTIASFMSTSPLMGWSAFTVIAGFLSVFPAAFKWSLGYMPGACLRLLLLAPALWVALETVRFDAFGGLPWLSLAATQVDGPLSTWMPVVGEAGLDWLIVTINGIVALSFIRLRVPTMPRVPVTVPIGVGLAIAIASIGLAGSAWTVRDDESLRVGLVQAAVPGRQAISRQERADYMDSFDVLVRNLSPDIDLVVFPEAAIHVRGEEWRDYLADSFESDAAALIGVLEDTPGGDRYNSAMLLTSDGTSVYRKQRRVPIAEYRPDWLTALIYRTGPAPASILRGRITAPLRYSNVKLGLTICWEVFFGDAVAARVRDGAGLILNLANESWIRSDIAHARSLAVARMRAAENGRMLVRVANRGISAVIEADGRVVERFEAMEPL